MQHGGPDHKEITWPTLILDCVRYATNHPDDPEYVTKPQAAQ